MTIEQMRARLAAIVATLETFQGDLDDSQIDEVNALNEEFKGLTAKIEAQEKIEAMKAQATSSTRKTPAASPSIEVIGNRIEKDPKRGFKNAGDFFMAVKNKKDQVLAAAGLNEKFGEEGGYLVPEEFRQEISNKVMGDESLLPRTQSLQTSSNTITLPTYEQAPWDGTGIQAYWEGEAAQFKKSRPEYGQASMRLHKLTALVPATQEVLEDAPLLESWIRQNAPVAMLHKVNSAIISGSGAGMPQGFLNSSFKVKVAKESGQAADTVLFENINKMLGSFLPSSLPRAVWLVNPNVLPQLRLMKFTDNSPIYLPGANIAGAPFGTLYGVPLMPMMGGVKALGDEGDISLVDLSYVLTAMKVSGGGLGVRSEVSTHVYFDTDEVAFKFVMRMAGQCLYKTPITNEAGDFSASAFVTLADRA